MTPSVTQKATPKDVFLHLLAMVTLYVSVVAFIALWWQYINFLFPDQLQYAGYGSYTYDPIRIATATLLVVFPVFILLSWLIGRDFKAEPAKRDLKIRKWLIYLTLFISAITIIIDLIILINNFLRGDLTTQFLLKVLVVLLIAAAVFGYFIWDLRQKDKKSGKPKLFAWITSAVILASIVYGFVLIGTPSRQRAIRFDEMRVNHLSQLQFSIFDYWQRKDQLPSALADLETNIGYNLPKDPETGQMYEYRVTGNLSFELCSDFKTSSGVSRITDKTSTPRGPYGGPEFTSWDHDVGRKCFERTIDPDLYRQPKL